MILSPPGSLPKPAVTFWGAAKSVTGSMHLVEAGGRKLLLDCGLFRGPREESRRRNLEFPFDPHTLDAVILSHAHIDHCGNLPNLVRQGFSGPIYCTPPTRDLLGIMLADSARLHEEDAFVVQVVGGAAEPAFQPLSTRLDTHRALLQCIAVPYEQDYPIGSGMLLRFADAGHILGSAITLLTIPGRGGRDWRLAFSGDLGRRGLPFLREPAPIPPADLILCEATYGGRTHQSVREMADALAVVVRRSAEQGGKVLVPAFSLGRTQVVVHYLRQWMRAGLLPRLPVYVDGSVAADIAEVYLRYPELLLEPVAAALEEDATAPGKDGVHYVRSPQESKELSVQGGPCIIVAPSGMCEGGRIMHYLKENLDDPRSSIVLVSYQAPGSLGRKLLEPRPTVRFHGRQWNLWANVLNIDGFSGHAGHDELLDALGPLAAPGRKVRLVHGEPERAEKLAQSLRVAGFSDVAVPARGETVSLG
jgi:metallo-beta-lactamase family protein